MPTVPMPLPKSRTEPADGQPARAQQFGLEMLQVHPQVGALDEIDGQPGIGVHLAGDGVLFGIRNAAALGQGGGIGPGHEASFTKASRSAGFWPGSVP